MFVFKKFREVERMSVLDDLLDDFMFQDASSIFDKSEKELLNDILREEQLSTDDDDFDDARS